MTPEILHWIADVLPRIISQSPRRTLEVGSQNINGSPRDLFTAYADTYIGTDMQDGFGVDRVLHNSRLLETFGAESFDLVICCECLEHDINYMDTVQQIRAIVRRGGLLLITTPTFGFPLHRYPKDYWRFGEDTYREVFFAGMDILDLRLLDNEHTGKDVTIAGLARRV